MKPASCIVLRPVSCLVFLMFVVLSLAGLLIPLWINRVRRIENEVNSIVYNINQELFSSTKRASSLFSPINVSAISLAHFLSSSLDENELRTFSHIQSKVARTLFLAISTVPFISEVAYIGLDGLFFGYYVKGGRPFALYSNYTFASTRNASKDITWYTQPANATGELYGEAIKFPPSHVINTIWFQSALNNSNVHASVETDWADSQDLMLLVNAGMDRTGAITFGYSVRSLIHFFTAGVCFHNGSLILATKDGIMLNEGIPNTRMILIDNRASFDLLGPDGDRVGTVGNITCHSDIGTVTDYVLRIWGRKYAISCSSVEIAGLQLVYVLALPYSHLSAFIHNNIMSAFILLLIFIGCMIITICTFVYLIVVAARREMNLCGALIKHMEATRQAERKSMSKSLAFASASHDIRASLAGITGLIEMSQNIVPKRDPSGPELHTNLLQMEGCSKDLLGILNTILDTTKIDAGKMQLEEEEFDIGQLLEDVVDLFHPVGMKKGVDIILDPYDGSIIKSSRVRGDRVKLKQILCNLLSNAVKFTSEGHVVVRAWARKSSLETDILDSNKSYGLVRCLSCLFFQVDRAYSESGVVKSIQLDPNGMEFVFEVNDTGKGIPKEQQKSVFENYVQLKETSFGTEGTGLGLGIVQSLVRLMGGEIEIMDKEVGEKGTCFRFNTFFSLCSTDISTNAGEVDVEAHGVYISSDSFRRSGSIIRTQSPKSEVSQVILLLQSAKRSGILQNYMERQGIKVHNMKQYHQLSPTLKKIKRKLRLCQYSSSAKSDVNSRSDDHMSRASSTKSLKEVPLSALDGTDNAVHFHRPFREISRAIAEFRKDLNNGCCSRVVWLDKPGSESSNIQGLGEHALPQSDIVMSKPFHGSRLHQTISLLPELRGMPLPRKGETTHNAEDIDSLGVAGPSGSTMNVTKKGVKEQSSEDDVGIRQVEEIKVQETDKIKPLNGKKILVAEDDPVGLRIATSVALQLGAVTSSCRNGEEALELVCKGLKDETITRASKNLKPFDCILMDCEMPIMNGIEATRRIRQEEGFYGVRIPIIALTAHVRGEEIDMMIEAGVDDLLTKPLNKQNLMKVVSKFIFER
ncbi:histidine kinase CKI1-like isoform X2 [Henckelia pumila]|uniref:histidine kinase CKI1-like isoform X2 n=1 Tax=Henckelia pumila TaxID=405737 RepID=UPI003C6E019A